MSNATILISFFTNFFIVLFIIALLNRKFVIKGEHNEYWKKDVLWGYISLLLVQGINVILLPVIVRYLNFAELGVWYTFTSLYGLAMLIDFGFQTIITRNISYLWSGAQSIKSIGFEVVGDIDKK